MLALHSPASSMRMASKSTAVVVVVSNPVDVLTDIDYKGSTCYGIGLEQVRIVPDSFSIHGYWSKGSVLRIADHRTFGKLFVLFLFYDPDSISYVNVNDISNVRHKSCGSEKGAFNRGSRFFSGIE